MECLGGGRGLQQKKPGHRGFLNWSKALWFLTLKPHEGVTETEMPVVTKIQYNKLGNLA